jgi:hypothetical protein
VVITSVFIDSLVMRWLRSAVHPLVVSKGFLEARPWAAVAAKRWGDR